MNGTDSGVSNGIIHLFREFYDSIKEKLVIRMLRSFQSVKRFQSAIIYNWMFLFVQITREAC